MSEITEIIETIVDNSTAKKAAEKLKKVTPVLTSLTESQALFRKKLEELNLKYNKESGDYDVKSA